MRRCWGGGGEAVPSVEPVEWGNDVCETLLGGEAAGADLDMMGMWSLAVLLWGVILSCGDLGPLRFLFLHTAFLLSLPRMELPIGSTGNLR